MENLNSKKIAGAFAAAFAKSLGDSFSAAAETAYPLEVSASPDLPTQKGAPVHFRLSLEGALKGDFFVEFSELQLRELMEQIVKQPVTILTDAHFEMLSKLIASAAKGLVASNPSDYGQFQFRVSRVDGIAFGGMFVVPVASTEGTPEFVTMLYFGGPMLDTLSSFAREEVDSTNEATLVAPHNLKLVMDVELNVSLRFGQRQLPLREVLELGNGSVVELDRMVDEPVELFLDGKLIARGEAVVVDGNYGLRVTEIPRPIASYLVN